jgi:hypothetical protein
LPPTFNLCFYRACKSLHERGFDTLSQGNLQGGGVVFWTIKVLATLEKMGSRLILEYVLLEHSALTLRVTPNVQETWILVSKYPISPTSTVYRRIKRSYLRPLSKPRKNQILLHRKAWAPQCQVARIKKK